MRIYLCFTPSLFSHVFPIYHVDMYAHAYTHCKMRAQSYILCKYMFPMFVEVKMLHQLNMHNVRHMHTLVCKVFKWNYEQHVNGHSLTPMVYRIVRTYVPFKASAHSFKQFTSRLLKLSFSHSMHIYLGWTSCLISFAWGQSTCQERVGSDKIQNEKFLVHSGTRTHNP